MDSSDVVIRVEGLGKKYIIQHEKTEKHSTISGALSQRAAALGRWANPFTLASQIHRARGHAAHEHRRGEEDFWALKDVSFEIHRGERVGIIGRNGAGKSTLLKILSRITEPTTGRVEIRGRVASLLEVGTGFHPELSGRENIYLNGAILGMKRREIQAKFDEIVDFAEVEKFLDTPVKRYSSGMYVRLAFAVAAHLEPEILVVDEVLAVGDASFQKKCLGKMEDVAEQEGRTVLFVSHQMNAITTLCNKSILLEGGSISFSGEVSSALSRYLASSDSSFLQFWGLSRRGALGIDFRFGEVNVIYSDHNKLAIDVQTGVQLRSGKPCLISLGFCSITGELLFNCPFIWHPPASCVSVTEKRVTFRLHFSRPPLCEGTYAINFFCEQNGIVLDHLPSAFHISMPPAVGLSGDVAKANSRRKGVVIDYEWEIASQGSVSV